jgi:deoxyribodipyrimidine photolyase
MVITPGVKPGNRNRGRPPPAIVWLRQDLRLADNSALQAACRRGGPIVPVFVWAPDEEGA